MSLHASKVALDQNIRRKLHIVFGHAHFEEERLHGSPHPLLAHVDAVFLGDFQSFKHRDKTWSERGHSAALLRRTLTRNAWCRA